MKTEFAKVVKEKQSALERISELEKLLDRETGRMRTDLKKVKANLKKVEKEKETALFNVNVNQAKILELEKNVDGKEKELKKQEKKRNIHFRGNCGLLRLGSP